MTSFDSEYFQKTDFSEKQVDQFLQSAERDLSIAEQSDIPEVIFKFSYDSLIKIGIALIATNGYKVRSKIGQHVKIIEKMSEMLGNGDISVLANKMRQDRNVDLYGGGDVVSRKESGEYLEFVKKVLKKALKNK